MRSPFYRLGLFFLSFGAATLCSAETGFLSPELEKASPSELAERANAAPADSFPQALFRLFLADSLIAQTKWHAARAAYLSVSETCDRWEQDDYGSQKEAGRAAMVCALVEMEILADGSLISRFTHAPRLRRARLRAFQGPATPDKHHYFEGRLFAGLTPAEGQDFKKALLALRVLQTTHPDDGSVLFWTAKVFERQGNAVHANETYREAAARGYQPATAEMARRVLGFEREADGRYASVTPGLFYSPAEGAGFRLELRDDRIFDDERGGRLGGFVTTRGQVGVETAIWDQALLPPVRLYFTGSLRDGVEDFYGLGMQSPGASSVSLNVRRTELEIGARVSFYPDFFLSVGWRQSGAERTDTGTPVGYFGFQNGASATLSYDSRDSFTDPTSGALVSAASYFPTTGFGSARSLREWRLHAEWHWPLHLRHGVHLRAGAVLLDGEAPFSQFPDLARDSRLPGVREFRYRDRNVLGVSAEYQWRPLPPFSLAAFFSLGTSSTNSSGILSSVAKAGGGLAWIGHLARYRSASPRLELACFGGEWIVQGALGVAF